MSDQPDVRGLVLRTLMPGFAGTAVPGWLDAALRDGLGSVCLYGSNVVDVDQLTALCADLRSRSSHVVLATDEEGGDVTRLHYRTGSPYVGNGVLGRLDDLDATRDQAAWIARDLRGVGIQLDLGPVVDVNSSDDNPVIGSRSFGADPALVARHSAAWVQALQVGGVAACAKHFPGHGDTDKDSHLDLPVVEHSRSRLEDIELRPFRKAIAAKVATIMTAHIVVRELDEKVPATLSSAVVTTLLRDQLGYKGVIVADDLEMKAVSAHWPFAVSAVLAAKAGCDLLPVCEHEEAQVAVIEALIRAEESADLRKRDIDDALLRIEAMIDKYTLPYAEPTAKAAVAAAGKTEARLLAAQIAGVAV